jgi:periplasmic divalent cation tolerance protein
MEDSEFVIVYSTFPEPAAAEAVIAAARPLHPYEVPCFLILPVEGGFAPYLARLKAATV